MTTTESGCSGFFGNNSPIRKDIQFTIMGKKVKQFFTFEKLEQIIFGNLCLNYDYLILKIVADSFSDPQIIDY